MRRVWLDGRFLPEAKALVPATDPAFLYGRGVFEVVRGYDGVAFRLEDHVARLRASARRFGIRFRAPDLARVIRELCVLNRAPDAYVRLTLSAGGRLLVIARPRRPLPAAWYGKGAKVLFARWRRDPRAPLVGHKTLNYLENVLSHDEALRRGRADMIYRGLKGEILEGCVSNVFGVRGGKILTPPLRQGILPGVTRKVVMELARVKERTLYARDLERADEAFLTNSLVEVLPLGPPGPVTSSLMGRYSEAVHAYLRSRRRAW